MPCLPACLADLLSFLISLMLLLSSSSSSALSSASSGAPSSSCLRVVGDIVGRRYGVLVGGVAVGGGVEGELDDGGIVEGELVDGSSVAMVDREGNESTVTARIDGDNVVPSDAVLEETCEIVHGSSVAKFDREGDDPMAVAKKDGDDVVPSVAVLEGSRTSDLFNSAVAVSPLLAATNNTNMASDATTGRKAIISRIILLLRRPVSSRLCLDLDPVRSSLSTISISNSTSETGRSSKSIELYRSTSSSVFICRMIVALHPLEIVCGVHLHLTLVIGVLSIDNACAQRCRAAIAPLVFIAV